MKIYHVEDWQEEIPPDTEYMMVDKSQGYMAWCHSKVTTTGKPQETYHRLGGPARIWTDGSEEWYIRGKCHRIDGPATTNTDNGIITWRINGNYVRSYDELQELTGCSDEDIVAYKLKWGEIQTYGPK